MDFFKFLFGNRKKDETVQQINEKTNNESGKKEIFKVLPDAPYGPKISNITNEGIEFYWKKVEKADGYEVFRSYKASGPFEKIGEIATRGKGEFLDTTFDRSQKNVFYKSRSYLNTDAGERTVSEFTKAATAIYRDELILERDVTYMYDHSSRHLKAFYGWGEVTDPEWTSENTEVAVVESDGTIKAFTTGETVIRCSSKLLGREATAKVVVNRKSLEPLDTGKRRFVYNSETNCWENKSSDKMNEAVIMMVGDMMCGAAQTRAQYTAENGYSYNDSYEFVKTTTAQSDFAVGNLETLMASGFPYMIDESYIDNKNNCNNPSRYLDAVLYGGFDAVTMSNNHNCDGGIRALHDTIDEVDLRNIPRTGVFKNEDEERFMIVDINGIKVGFLAYMSRYTGFNGKDATWTKKEKATFLNVFSKEKAEKDIADCKNAGAEYIIAYMHWGKKNYKSITKEQAKEAQAAADAGIDYIVGANPHVVQKYDEIQAADGRIVPCFYSTGNFQAYMNQIPGNRDSIMVRIKLVKKEDGTIILEDNAYIPYHTYKLEKGCHWAPQATSMVYDKHIKVSGRKKYFERISSVVGNKVKAL